MIKEKIKIPDEMKLKLKKIVNYLKKKNVDKIILFGSIAEGDYTERSDIDIAVSGLSTRDYFTAIAELPLIVRHSIDLVDLKDLTENFKELIGEDSIILYEN